MVGITVTQRGKVHHVHTVNPIPLPPQTPRCSLSNIFMCPLLCKINIFPDQEVRLSSSLNPVLNDMASEDEPAILLSMTFSLQDFSP